MSRDNFADVGDFHRRFGLTAVNHEGVRPRRPDPELLEFRVKFLCEELQEFMEGMGVDFGTFDLFKRLPMISHDRHVDHAQMFDALIDLVYVALGTAHLLGYPWPHGWDRVQAANMAKVRAKADGSDSKRGSSFDVVKPEGWTPPDIEGLLAAFGWNTISPHEFEVFDGASGMVCTAMVLRDGHGDACGMPATHPVHPHSADAHEGMGLDTSHPKEPNR